MSGGGFDEIFFSHSKYIFVEPFDLPAEGQLFISYDHGDSKPCAVLFWWESRGGDIRLKNGRIKHTLPGDLFLIGEVYLWSGRPNEGIKPSIADVTTAIQKYKILRGWRYRDPLSQKWIDLFKRRCYADSAIFSDMNEFNISEQFKTPVRIDGEQHPGIEWQPVEKPPNSRKDGFTLMREKLLFTGPRAGSNVRESPGLFVVKESCPQWARVIPTLPRDKKNPDVIDEKSEDHLFDCTRYGLAADRSAHVRFDRRQVW